MGPGWRMTERGLPFWHGRGFEEGLRRGVVGRGTRAGWGVFAWVRADVGGRGVC